MRCDIVLAGLGGQGALTMAGVLVRAAVREGYDAHMLAQSGIAQLGSPILAHVRIGVPAGPSPKIPKGRASFALALERREASSLVPYLAPDAQALLSREAIRPYAARFRKGMYPEEAEIESAFAPCRTRWVPAEELARRHGPPVLVSSVMLGAFAGANQVIDRDNLVICLREAHPEMADLEAEAFFAGYTYITGTEL
jgi:indolepyruvate ferredoxin oxidoreductase, beta subunit